MEKQALANTVEVPSEKILKDKLSTKNRDFSLKSIEHDFLKFYKKQRLFVFTVLLPTLISFIYFGFIASDVFISESQFLVRSSKQQQPSALGIIFGSSFSSASTDSHSVSAFMLSRDALQRLNSELNYEKLYSRSDVDFISKFGVLAWNKSFESLHSYYQKHVSINFDITSSISTLKVKAFNPSDAYKINEHLLQLAEKHINLLNERARQDLIKFAKAELDQAEKAAANATYALANYRNRSSVFNPAEYEKLVVEKGFTLEQLKMRRASLESAITDAMRQILYLERVVQPNKPDYALEPTRVKNIISTFVIGLVLWGILSMLVAGVREHHD